MKNGRHGTKGEIVKPVGTWDFASSVEMLTAIDLTMRQCFGAGNWLPVRRKLFPGLRR